MKNFFFVFALVLFPVSVFAAVTVTSTGSSTGSSYTLSGFDCNGGNYLLATSQIQGGTHAIGGATYGSSALTKIAGITGNGFGELWALKNPPSGTHDLAFNYTINGDPDRTHVMAICVSGAQRLGTGLLATGWPGDTSGTLEDPSALANDMMLGFYWEANSAVLTFPGEDIFAQSVDYNNMWGFYKSSTMSLSWIANQPTYYGFLAVNVVGIPSGPSAPIDLLVDGQINPINLATTSPYFSAIHANASTTMLAASYQIQVATSSDYWGAPYWDSGQLSLSSSTSMGMRTPDIFSAPIFVPNGSTYYWRIRLIDRDGAIGAWSTTTASFSMTATPALDATGHSSGTGNFSVLMNTSSGDDRLLVCGLYVQSSKSPTNVSAKWNSTETMTKLTSFSPEWSSSGTENIYYFFLLGGTAGGHGVGFTVTGAGTGVFDYATCASYTGVAQTGQPNTSSIHMETSVQSLSTSNKVAYNGSLLVGFTFFNGGNTSAPTAGSGTTLRDFTDTTNWHGVLSDNGSNVLSVGNPSLNINRSVSGNIATLQASWSPVHN